MYFTKIYDKLNFMVYDCVGLKVSAKEAKKRFKTGYWENFCKVKTKRLEDAKQQGKSEQEVIVGLTRQAKNDIALNYGKRSEDDILYAEVCEMLSSGEIILNPIRRLINEEAYSKLTANQKEDYIMRLSLKFQEMRERYEREKIC